MDGFIQHRQKYAVLTNYARDLIRIDLKITFVIGTANTDNNVIIVV